MHVSHSYMIYKFGNVCLPKHILKTLQSPFICSTNCRGEITYDNIWKPYHTATTTASCGNVYDEDGSRWA